MSSANHPYVVTPLDNETCELCGAVLPANEHATGLDGHIFCPPPAGVSGTWGRCVEAHLRHRDDPDTMRDLRIFRYWPAAGCEEMAEDFAAAGAQEQHAAVDADFVRLAANARTAADLKRGKTIATPPPALWMRAARVPSPADGPLPPRAPLPLTPGVSAAPEPGDEDR